MYYIKYDRERIKLMKNSKKILFSIALVLITVCAFVMTANAADITTVYEGWALNTDANSDGSANDIWYTLDSEGTLTFASKNGNSTELVTRDYNSWRSNPWMSWKTEIKKIVFSSEITSLNTYAAFNGCSNLVSVEFGAANLTLVDDGGAFSECPLLVTFGQTGNLQENVFDLRNVETPEYKNTKNTFSGNAAGKEITVLLPYASSKICFNKSWTNAYTATIQCWETATKVTMKLTQGSCYDTVSCTLKVTNTTTWSKEDRVYPNGVFGDSYWTDSRYVKEYYSDMDLPLYDASSEGFVQKLNADNTTENDGTENDIRWRLNSAGTLVIYGEGTTLNVNPAANWDAEKNQPWTSYRAKVKRVVFETPNLKTISNASYLFMKMTALTTVVLPEQTITVKGDNMFSGCTAMATFGPEGTPANTFDLRNFVSTASCNTNFFVSVPAKEITVLMPYGATVRPAVGYTWNNVLLANGFTTASKVTFKVIPGTNGETVANTFVEKDSSKYFVESYKPGEAIVTGTGRSEHTNESWYCDWAYDLDLVTGVLNIKHTGGTPNRYIYKNNSTMNTIAADYGNLVTRINFIGFQMIYEGWGGAIASNKFTKLTTIDIGSINDFRPGAATTWFAAPALSTFGSSVRGTIKEGVIDLGGIGFRSSDFKLFNGASGAKELIINGNSMAAVTATTFVGFAGLEKITLGEKATVTDGAFDAFTALNAIEITNKSFTDTADKIFPDKEGLKVICYSKTSYDSIIAAEYAQTQAIYFGDVVKATGFAVRLKDYNGLRSIFSFNDTRKAELEETGLSFVEYGAMLISEAKLNSFGAPLALVKNGDAYEANTSYAVKLPIYVGKTLVGKVLSDNPDNNESTTDFAVTVTNYKSNYNDNIYTVAYAVFTDANGNEYIEYANYGDTEDKEDYKYVSIYNIAVGMAASGELNGKVVDEAPVWGIIGTGSLTLDSANSLNEITLDNGVSYMMVAANKAGENILFVRCADGTAPTAAQISAAEEKTVDLEITTVKTVTLTVNDDPDFQVKTEWQYGLDAQLEAAGLKASDKSFIFVTDTHWELDTKNKKAWTFTTDVMKYVSNQLGDITVVHGGDLYGGYSAAFDENNPYANINNALQVTDDYITDQLYKNFAGNFLYTLGNHDTNIIGYREAMKAVADGGLGLDKATAMEYYLNSDKETYDHTVGVVDASMAGAGKTVVYDTEGITRFQDVLKANGYTDEATLKEAEYLMKMHYHYDDTARGIRYIVLDTGGCGRTQMGVYNNGWTAILPAQTMWLAKTLKSTPEGYDIAVIGHQTSYVHTGITDGQKDFGYNMAPLYNVISGFKQGKAVTIDCSNSTVQWAFGNYGPVYEGVYRANNDSANADVKAALDFTGVQFNGTIFTLAGHEHADDAWYVNNNGGLTNVQFGSEEAAADGAVLSILTGNASWYNTSASVDGVQMNSTYPNSMRFDIVTINDDGSVKLTRIGAGQSRSFAY